MYISKQKKILTTILLLTALAAVGWLLRHNSDKSSNDKAAVSEQKSIVQACDAFSTEDAKKTFGDDVFQNSLDNKNDGYKPPTNIEDAPKVQTTYSTCIYTKGQAISTESDGQSKPSPADVKAVPEGDQKPVDATPILNETKKANPQPVPMPELLAVITMRSTTEENAISDFSRSKPKVAQNVENLGKAAFWNPDAVSITGKKQGSLSILAKDKIFLVTGDNMDIETAKKIANTILDKLQ